MIPPLPQQLRQGRSSLSEARRLRRKGLSSYLSGPIEGCLRQPVRSTIGSFDSRPEPQQSKDPLSRPVETPSKAGRRPFEDLSNAREAFRNRPETASEPPQKPSRNRQPGSPSEPLSEIASETILVIVRRNRPENPSRKRIRRPLPGTVPGPFGNRPRCYSSIKSTFTCRWKASCSDICVSVEATP